ncbi:MAG: hypothetical protein IT426_14490 [Pirellulales bacterium]|nr:hypothetical protein [Pirellulales bacterium]
MSHPLEQRLILLRGRARRLMAVSGFCALLAGVLGSGMALGWLDYFVHFEDRGLRIMASLALAGVVGWSAYRFIYLPRRKRLDDLALSLQVERRFPNLEDRLASAVEFLGQDEDDPTAGSPALRRAVIAQTVAETENLDFFSVLDARPAARGAWMAAAACLLAAIFVLLDPVIAGTAIMRLLNPLGSTAWPRKNHLTIRDPVEKVARGGAFEVQVCDADGATLPHELRVIYRFAAPDGATTEENAVFRASGVTAALRRENVLRPFAYRVEGGDDHSMAWRNVEVVEPPAVESLAAKLFPPPYTGWPAEKSDGNLRALVGTRIEFQAKATKPLKSAKLLLEGGGEFSGRLSEDGMRMTFADPTLAVTASGGYRLELVDREGLSGGGGAFGEIRAVPDAPPGAIVEQPSGNIYVTPAAAVPLIITAKDDLAVREISLKYRAVNATPNADRSPPAETAISLYSGPEKMPPQPAGGLANVSSGSRQTVEYRWELEPMKLSPGMQIELVAEASDYLPQTARGDTRRLFVVTQRELQDRLTARQNLLAAELLRALAMQQSGREQIEGLRIRLQELKQFEQPDLDRLRAAEINQRQVNNLLTSAGEGLPMHALAILSDLENNRLDTPELVERMQDILAELDRVGREHLLEIGKKLTSALKTAEVSLNEKSTAADHLKEASESLDSTAIQQEQVVAALERLLAQLKQSEGYRRFHRELSLLLRDQEETERRTGEVGKRTLTKPLVELPPQDVADLRILAARQGEHARTLDRILQAMRQAAEELRRDDPVAADTLSDALEEASRMAIGGSMRAGGEYLRQNQLGQAAASQKEIIRQLQEVLDILANRRNRELDRLVKKLREAAADIDAIAKEQAELHRAMEKNAQNPPDAGAKQAWRRLAEEQARLRQETEKLTRRLERLTAQQAAAAATRAAGEMGAAGEAAAAGNGAGACQGAAAAEKSLAEAARQLDERKRQAELDLAVEQLARLEDSVKHLHAQQQKAGEETERLDKLRQQAGDWSRSQLASLRDIARMQRGLREDAKKLAEQLAAAGAFNLTLNGAAADMGRAADLLDERATGRETRAAQQNALRRLDLLLEALKPEPPPAKKDEENAGGAGGQGKQGVKPPGDGIKKLAELKLLKLLQQEIQFRTVELQQAVGAGGANEDQRRQFSQLAEEQGRLAELMLKMLQPVETAPEENPENVPVKREDGQNEK